MGLVSIGEDEEDRRNDGAHEQGGSRVVALISTSARPCRTEKGPTEKHKMASRQALRIEALERELTQARAEIEKLTRQLRYLGWQARVLKRRGLVTDGIEVKRSNRIRTIRPDKKK